MIGFTVRGLDAEGHDAQYPAPDDVLRNTSLVGWPIIRDAREALTDARCACIEAQGWRTARVYLINDDDSVTLVGTVSEHVTPAEVLVWVEVAGGPRLGYGTITEAIDALEDELRETRVMAELEAQRIAERYGTIAEAIDALEDEAQR